MEINQKTRSTWIKHLQDEVDASYLYKIIAEKTPDKKQKEIYLKLGQVEEKHIKAWRDLLKEQNIKIKELHPSFKARFLKWSTDRFGPALLSKYLLKEEATEVKNYLGLYKSSPNGVTKNIALKLARDSAQHANKLMDTHGVKDEPWHSSESGGLLRNVVYGFNDGLTANFGLIAGVIGASAAPHFILISGIAGIVADSLSMGSSGYLAAVSEREVFEYEKSMEREEIALMPDLETEELTLIYESKGMSREDARSLAEETMKNPEQALEDKIREELGIVEHKSSPFREGWVTGLATAIGALIPVFPFFFSSGFTAIAISFVISMAAHFGVGAARSFFTGRGIFKSGFDMFIVGFGVAAVGYVIGELIVKFL